MNLKKWWQHVAPAHLNIHGNCLRQWCFWESPNTVPQFLYICFFFPRKAPRFAGIISVTTIFQQQSWSSKGWYSSGWNNDKVKSNKIETSAVLWPLVSDITIQKNSYLNVKYSWTYLNYRLKLLEDFSSIQFTELGTKGNLPSQWWKKEFLVMMTLTPGDDCSYRGSPYF